MHTIHAIRAILEEDLPKDAIFCWRHGKRNNDVIVVELWPRRAYSDKKDAHPFRFNVRLVGRFIIVYVVDYYLDTVLTRELFELADPDVFKKVFSYFARKCVL